MGFVACNQEKQKSPEKTLENKEIIDDLNLKLDATEAQLYNVRVELAKCKGDSLPELKSN